MTETQAWPTKQREMHSHHFDSTVWNDFDFRDDDVIIATYGKSGTTWAQQMVGQMLLGPDPAISVAELSPWVDLRVPPKEIKLAMMADQAHRRFLKTHLPVDALVYSPKAKYVYVGRDARDIVWSLYNHHVNANTVWYDAINNTPGRIGPPIDPPTDDIHAYWHEWLARDGFPFWSFWENLRSWWSIRNLPNVMYMHYANMRSDMEGEMRQLASFLDIEIDDQHWPQLVEYCSFDWMKRNANQSAPLGGAFFDDGGKVFINKGTNGRWTDVLTADDSAAFEKLAKEQLGESCATWMISGREP